MKDESNLVAMICRPINSMTNEAMSEDELRIVYREGNELYEKWQYSNVQLRVNPTVTDTGDD